MNVEVARQCLEHLFALGVRELCLCPGSRNAPLVELLSRSSDFHLWTFFEERSAAFFALGRSQVLRQPVAVITTSGTAAAELLPAAIEAHYLRVPLVLVTADRPKSYRGQGAPQSIEQVGLFSTYVESSLDCSPEDLTPWSELSSWSVQRPIHINLCFDEPLIDGPLMDGSLLDLELCLKEAQAPKKARDFSPSLSTQSGTGSVAESLRAFAQRSQRPLVIVGGLPLGYAERVAELLIAVGAPCLLEAPSGLRQGPEELRRLQWTSGESLLRELIRQGEIDGILRFGGVPSLRLWRDLEKEFRSLPVLSFALGGFSGLSRQRPSSSTESVHLERLWGAEPSALETVQVLSNCWPGSQRQALLDRDRDRRRQLDQLVDGEPESEWAWVRRISESIGPKAHVFLGNSLPVREWDNWASVGPRQWRIHANRGANGIDGLVSSFLGLIQGSDEENWALLGDLSALYDLAGLWPLGQIQARLQARAQLVILNNQGGQIFRGLYGHPIYQNRHQLGFRSWAEMWGLEYRLLTQPQELKALDSVSMIFEVRPDNQATERLERALKKGL